MLLYYYLIISSPTPCSSSHNYNTAVNSQQNGLPGMAYRW